MTSLNPGKMYSGPSEKLQSKCFRIIVTNIIKIIKEILNLYNDF